MRRAPLTFVLVLVSGTLLACSSASDPPTSTPDSALDDSAGADTALANDGATDGAGDATTDAGPRLLGARCTSDADCGGLTCYSEEKTGVPQGVCSVVCTADADCDAIVKDAVCGFPINRPAEPKLKLCREPCRLGPASTALKEPLDPAKCHGRPEFACLSATSGSQCRPLCNVDADCTGGRHCAPDSQLCVKTPTDWSSIGVETETGCAGTLFGVGGVTVCGGICTRGTGPACGWAGGSARVERVCQHREGTTAGGFGTGDLGDCWAACDCDDDCSGKDLACVAMSADDVKTTGRKGVCRPGKRGALACAGDAGPGDAGDAGDSGPTDASDGGG